jgi:hypothetical protein
MCQHKGVQKIRFRYNQTFFTFHKGKQAYPINPTIETDSGLSFSSRQIIFQVHPPLPAGLSVDKRTGSIVGIPKKEAPPRHFRVSAILGPVVETAFITIKVVSNANAQPSMQIHHHHHSCFAKVFQVARP